MALLPEHFSSMMVPDQSAASAVRAVKANATTIFFT
jgi:hypothetical protein